MQLFTRKKLLIYAISSFCLFIFSIVLAYVILPAVIDSQIDRNVQLVRGTDQWERFIKLPFNLTFNVTLFEVKNPKNVVNLGENPNLQEKGPFVFDEIVTKENLIYNENNGTVMFTRKTELYFNEDKSNGLKYDDKITLINPAYIAVMQIISAVPLIGGVLAPFVQKCMKDLFPNGPIMTIEVSRLLFEGVDICDFENKNCKEFCYIFLKVESKTIDKSEDGKHVTFSFLKYKTKGSDGVYEIKTGIENIQDVGQIVTWNYLDHTKFWSQKKLDGSCDEVKGTDGTLFAPHVTENTKLVVYSTDICRTASVEYGGTGTYEGIDGLLFKASPKLFYSSTDHTWEDCFCINKTKNENDENYCYLDGVMDMYSCIGAPVLVSYPHFLHADERYLKKLNGVVPDEEKHGLSVLIDPYVGVPLQAHKRAQMSINLRPIKFFDELTSNFPRTILPIIWIDEGIDLPKEGLDLLNSLLYDTLKLVNILKRTLIGVTLVFTVFSTILWYKKRE